MNVVVMVGSIRKDSYNQQIACFIKKRYQDFINLEMLNIKELPYYDQDLEEFPPESVKEFKQKVKEAEAVLIVTPEYNHSIPGMLKNAIDWLSRVDKVMTGKPVLIIGATQGMLGTVRCQIHLRQILASPGLSSKVLPGNEVLIGMVHEKVDEQGNIKDKATLNFLDNVVKSFVQFSNEINNVKAKI